VDSPLIVPPPLGVSDMSGGPEGSPLSRPLAGRQVTGLVTSELVGKLAAALHALDKCDKDVSEPHQMIRWEQHGRHRLHQSTISYSFSRLRSTSATRT
jgi:hypothetical protein